MDAAAREAEHREAEIVGCGYCGASAGRPCVNMLDTGRALKHPHIERVRAAGRKRAGLA